MSLSRRRFAQSFAAGLVAGPWAAGRAWGDQGAESNPTGARFKFSLAAYSYRNLLQGNPPKMDLFQFVDDCARFQLEGTELTSYYFPKEVTDDFLYRLKRHCFREGLTISGTAVGNDFGWPEGAPERQQQIEHVKTWVRHAHKMGAPVIRVFAGHDKPGIDREQSHELMVSALKESCDYAGEHGVHLALENHGGPTATAQGLLRIVKDVDSPWFGVNLDTGNFHSADLYGELELAAPHAINVQVKVKVSGPDRKKVESDFGRLAQILRGADYRGFVVLEYEEGGDPRAASEGYLERLREALGTS